MRSGKCKLRALAVGLIAVLLTTLLPAPAMAASVKVKVNVKNMPVYVNCNGKVKKATIPKGTELKVTAVRNGVALFRYNGYYCIGQVKNMSEIKSEAAQPASGGSQRAVTKVATYVFQRPSTDSAHVRVKKGTQLQVLAVKGNIAQVKKNGVVAYAYRKHLLLEDEATQDQLEDLKDQLEAEQNQSQSRVPSVTEAFKSGNYSNEQLCYLFLTQVMGYNTAAAAGVLANINYESGFKTTLYGDSGTSYGLCQWHLGRRTRLLNYCKQNNVSADSLVGQLAYLKYELENFYPKVHRYLQGVSNTPQGAYDAAYYFCYNFEAPAARESQSVKRGSSAQNTYYGRYAAI